jgi:transposase
MPSSESESVGGSQRRRRLLSPSEKYEIWLQLTRGEVTMAEAAREYQVDRSVIAKLKRVARDGALASLSVSKPGPGARKRDYELEAAQDEVSRLTETVKEMAVKLTLLEGKDRWA